MKEEKTLGQKIYDETINFGRNSLIEFLMTKTRVFKEFQDMAAYVITMHKASNYPFFVVDTHFKIQYMNPACVEFTGLKLSEKSGNMSCRDIFESDLCLGDCAIQQAIMTKRCVVGKRVVVKDRDGKKHTIIVSAGALIDMSGEVLGGFEMWRDSMPDEEMTSRVNSLMFTLDNYCRDMMTLFQQLEEAIANEVGKGEEGNRIIEQMKQRMGMLMNSYHALHRSYCWNIMDCPPERQVQCPAFPNNGRTCWDVDYTWCDGQMQGTALEKIDQCTQCRVFAELKNKS